MLVRAAEPRRLGCRRLETYLHQAYSRKNVDCHFLHLRPICGTLSRSR